VAGGRLLFDAVQATWNLLERSASAALAEAHDAGVGVIVKEALANGRLTSRNDDPDFAPHCALLDQAARERGTTIDALALAGVLAQPWADVVLSGAAAVEHLSSNAAALEVTWDEELAARLAPLVEPAEIYWATRSELAWN
jgi:aryl-alcohol dehydrogenase-like predicted oxidoreductase